jgi:hypothetical protein
MATQSKEEMMRAIDPEEFVRRAPWRWAQTGDHQYVVRGLLADVELEQWFEPMVEYVREHGYVATFAGREYTYSQIGPHRYWTMGEPVSETTIINRAAEPDRRREDAIVEFVRSAPWRWSELSPNWSLLREDIPAEEFDAMLDVIGDDWLDLEVDGVPWRIRLCSDETCLHRWRLESLGGDDADDQRIPDSDEVADLADRLRAKLRRGEDPSYELGIEFAALTAAEQERFIVLIEQRAAHGTEQLEAVEENVRAIKALLVLQAERAPGMSLPEAIGSGRIGLLEVVEAIRGAVPDPLAQESD